MHAHSVTMVTKCGWRASRYNERFSKLPEVRHEKRIRALQHQSSGPLLGAALEGTVYRGRTRSDGARVQFRFVLVHAHPDLHWTGRQSRRTGQLLVTLPQMSRYGAMWVRVVVEPNQIGV